MKKYVLGICVSEDKSHICLIKKNRGPEGMAGTFNAPGGKVELGEPAIEAMVREFKEETGVHIPALNWRLVSYKTDDETFVVSIYLAITDEVYNCTTIEDEEISVVKIEDMPVLNLYDNLETIIAHIVDND